jgi:hypothetical protein
MIVGCVPGNNDQNDPGTDLALMSSCDHLILSYGTFGMMAAWFNNHGTALMSSENENECRLNDCDRAGDVVMADNFTGKPEFLSQTLKAIPSLKLHWIQV